MTFELNKFYKLKNGQVAEIIQIGTRSKLVYTGLRTMEFVDVKYYFAKVDEKRIYFGEDGKATSFLDTHYPDYDIVDKTPVIVEVIL